MDRHHLFYLFSYVQILLTNKGNRGGASFSISSYLKCQVTKIYLEPLFPTGDDQGLYIMQHT